MRKIDVIVGSVLAVIGLVVTMIPLWGIGPGLGLVIIGCTIVLASKK